MIRRFFLVTIMFFISFSWNAFASSNSFHAWMQKEALMAQSRIRHHLSIPNIGSGIVIASPSKKNPNYFYHWVRDAAITMHEVGMLFQSTQDLFWKQKVNAYIHRIAFLQKQKTLSNLGEPKFYVNGTPYLGPWGRPQNDGPALRVLTQLSFLKIQNLIPSALKRILLKNVRTDLRYLQKKWESPKGFDLWEEISGLHFFTLTIQKKAFLEAASRMDLFRQKSKSLFQTAKKINHLLEMFWDPTRSYYQSTRFRTGGRDDKISGLDSSIILATIFYSDLFSYHVFLQDKILHTAWKLIHTFEKLYPINQRFPHLAPAIGRYPEDRYQGGHPWFLTTAAFATFCYQVVQALLKQKKILLTPLSRPFFEKALHFQIHLAKKQAFLLQANEKPARFQALVRGVFHYGDLFLKRIKKHATKTGALSEQFHKNTGFQLSAKDLTWSYASVLQALRERAKAKRASERFFKRKN